jgi:hypothetical protein
MEKPLLSQFATVKKEKGVNREKREMMAPKAQKDRKEKQV